MNSQNGLPQGFQSRPARLEDSIEVVIMLNRWSLHRLGIKKFIPPELEMEWESPGFDLERDTCLVLAPRGEVVGYYEAWDLAEPHTRVALWGRVHPDFTGLGIGTYLLHWAEQRGRLAEALAPAGTRVYLQAFVLSTDQETRQLLLDNGFQIVRHNYRMVIEFDQPPAPAELPEGITIRSLVPEQDLPAMVYTVRESFRDHFGFVEMPLEQEVARWRHYIENDPAFDPDLYFLAFEGDEMVGTSLCRRQVDDDPGMGWVSTLGVRREWRRQGVGMALLQHSFYQLYQRGQRRVGLGVDAESLTGATRLYLKAGMHPDPAWQYTLYEKELRPGIDLSTRQLVAETAS